MSDDADDFVALAPSLTPAAARRAPVSVGTARFGNKAAGVWRLAVGLAPQIWTRLGGDEIDVAFSESRWQLRLVAQAGAPFARRGPKDKRGGWLGLPLPAAVKPIERFRVPASFAWQGDALIVDLPAALRRPPPALVGAVAGPAAACRASLPGAGARFIVRPSLVTPDATAALMGDPPPERSALAGRAR